MAIEPLGQVDGRLGDGSGGGGTAPGRPAAVDLGGIHLELAEAGTELLKHLQTY